MSDKALPLPARRALRRPRRTYTAAWTGAFGAVLLLGLGMAGQADPAPAAAAAAALLAFAAVQSARAGRSRRFDLQASAAGETRAAPGAGPSFYAIFEVLPDPALIVAAGAPDDLASRRVVSANAAARELLRIPREDAPLVSALRQPEVLEAVDETLFGGGARTSYWETGGAQDRVWRVWSAPLIAPSGETRALVIMHEQTDVRRAERTRADFLANASHELRTPLASLAGFVETLRGHARDDADVRERFLAIMAAQTARMSRLVDDLMSLSRVELNEHVPPAGVVDLGHAVADVCEALAPLARNRAVELRVSGPESSVLIAGERDGVVQVVQNLVDNALSFSPAGGSVEVEVGAGLDAESAPRATRPGAARLSLLTPDRASGQRYAAVRVRDQGPGIDREHLPRLTERFYRVEGQKSGARPGTGLGLAIVRHIVNRHRGGLAVDSTPGVGSTFVAWFPQLAEDSATKLS
jgi:two-component system phosphate regulon sensor histidine kinase PhoR